MTPSSRPRWLPWLAGAVALVVVLWPWPISPGDMVGSPRGEADRHLWMLWWAVRRAFGDTTLANWPGDFDWPLMDLVHLPPAFLLVDLHPGLTWGVVAAIDVALALAAGWCLSREVGASPAGALAGMLCLGSAPYLGGVLVTGMSEAWPVGWYGLHLAAFLRFARTGTRGSALAAVATLAAFALSGWYDALFAALASPLALLWAWRGVGADGRRLAALAGLGLLAAVLVLPAFLPLLGSDAWTGLAAREALQDPGKLGGLAYGGADLVGLVRPVLHADPLPKATYLGLGALALGAAALRRHPHARYAALGCAGFLLLSLGPILSVGEALPAGRTIRMPAAWLMGAVPVLGGVRDWYRAVGMAQVFLAPLAALGATALLRGRSVGWGLLPAACVLADALVLGGAPWPRPVYDPRPPGALADLPGTGPMAILPFDNYPGRWPGGATHAYLRWQVWWDRPISERIGPGDALLFDPVFAFLNRKCRAPGLAGVPDTQEDPLPGSPPSAEEVESTVARLVASGLDLVVVVRPRLNPTSTCEERITALLGPPDGVAPEAAWWRMRPGPP